VLRLDGDVSAGPEPQNQALQDGMEQEKENDRADAKRTIFPPRIRGSAGRSNSDAEKSIHGPKYSLKIPQIQPNKNACFF
jgi:hypothetical protein